MLRIALILLQWVSQISGFSVGGAVQRDVTDDFLCSVSPADKRQDAPESKAPHAENQEAEKLEKEVEENEMYFFAFGSFTHSVHLQTSLRFIAICRLQPGWCTSLYRPPIV